jgi:putative phosphonate transport system ATP-binding protein
MDQESIAEFLEHCCGGRRVNTGPEQVIRKASEADLAGVFEPTGGLDVSVQARVLDLLRGIVAEDGLAAIIVTDDLAVARLLAHRTMAMKGGIVIETGRTDHVLDDPQEPYTQLLVSSILPP